MTSLSFSEFGSHEAPIIQAIYNEASSYAHSVGTIDWPRPFPIDYLESYIQAKELFCARSDQGAPVACVRLTSRAEEQVWPDGVSALYIGRLAVGNKARGMSVASGLFFPTAQRMATSRNLNQLRLDCISHNTRLNNFYKKFFINQGDVNIVTRSGVPLTVTRYSRDASLAF